MSEKASLRAIATTPLVVWIALLAALAVTVAYALLPHAPLKPVVALSISALKATIIALFFMRLNKETSLVRLTALAGVFWLSFLFLFAFADYLTRAAPISG